MKFAWFEYGKNWCAFKPSADEFVGWFQRSLSTTGFVVAIFEGYRFRFQPESRKQRSRKLMSISGWWFGCYFLFSHILGIIILINFHIFQRGSNHQPDIEFPPFFAWMHLEFWSRIGRPHLPSCPIPKALPGFWVATLSPYVMLRKGNHPKISTLGNLKLGEGWSNSARFHGKAVNHDQKPWSCPR